MSIISHTPVTDYMAMTLDEIKDFMEAIRVVWERMHPPQGG